MHAEYCGNFGAQYLYCTFSKDSSLILRTIDFLADTTNNAHFGKMVILNFVVVASKSVIARVICFVEKYCKGAVQNIPSGR